LPATTAVGFPCFLCVPSIHAVVYTPVDLQSAIVAAFFCNAGLPRVNGGSASTFNVSGPHRAFTFVTACIFAASPNATLSIESSDDFIASIAASIASGQATLPRRDFHPLKHTSIHDARLQLLTNAPFLLAATQIAASATKGSLKSDKLSGIDVGGE